ncbi:MAG: efflux RND transporter periplasmic adaptor subunit [Gammaproteobacteria bacterium]|nr:efflux RND transporter periplasmic adaptor subunit [Gammaproteobacteria bacterium]MDH3535837.1 efflux RND transporter periplasmic adaptor subunit [Gammaproteobacteria bacterium]
MSKQLSANAPDTVYSSMPAVDCVINPFRVVDISSPVAGVIEKLYVERSQQVSAGQVVAELEASVERANVELARYRANVESEIELGKVNINFDRLRKKRVEGLLEAQNISRENADQIEREVQLSRWKLKQAKELADIRKLELRKAEEQLKQKSIPAPFDGFVLDTFKYRGEYVEDQAILRLAQLDPLVVEAIVPMENFGMVKSGMQAEILADVLLKDKLSGEVIAVDRIGDTASNTFGVKLSLPNPENRIPAGLKCIVKFIEMAPEQVAEEAVEPAKTEEAAETGNRVADETPKGFIERPAETADRSFPDRSVIRTSFNTTTDAESSGLRAAIIKANAAQVPEINTANPIDQDGSSTPRQVATAMATDAIEIPAASDMIPTSYMVLIEQPKTGAQDLVDRLRSAGVDDFLVFNSGVNKGHISLGVFSTRSNAVRRQQAIDQLGFTTFTIERYQ